MSNHIYFDKVAHIAAGEAAATYGFTRDYIARLCREGKVLGRKIGRNWFVDHASLKQFIVTQEHSRVLRGGALRDERAQEYKRARYTNKQENKAFFKQVPEKISSFTDRISSTTAHHSELIHDAARDISSHAGLSDAALRLTAQGAAHIPTYAMTPVAEFLHRLVALTMAVSIVFGLASAADRTLPLRTLQASQSISKAAINGYQSITHADWSRRAAQFSNNLAQSVRSPIKFTAAAFAALQSKTAESARVEAAITPAATRDSDFGTLHAKEAHIGTICSSGAAGQEICVSSEELLHLLKSKISVSE